MRALLLALPLLGCTEPNAPAFQWSDELRPSPLNMEGQVQHGPPAFVLEDDPKNSLGEARFVSMTASIETRLYLRCDGTNIWSGFYTTSPDIKAGLFDNILPELWVNCGDWLGRIELRFEVPQ